MQHYSRRLKRLNGFWMKFEISLLKINFFTWNDQLEQYISLQTAVILNNILIFYNTNNIFCTIRLKCLLHICISTRLFIYKASALYSGAFIKNYHKNIFNIKTLDNIIYFWTPFNTPFTKIQAYSADAMLNLHKMSLWYMILAESRDVSREYCPGPCIWGFHWKRRCNSPFKFIIMKVSWRESVYVMPAAMDFLQMYLQNTMKEKSVKSKDI